MSGLRRRRKRRVKYSAEEVVLRILYNPLYYRVAEIVFESEYPVHPSDVSRKLGISIGYASNILRKMEKWNVLKPVRDPVNGKIAFIVKDSTAARLLHEELRKRRAAEIQEEFEVVRLKRVEAR
jgi:DNA-binding MarR family transcriptional regulator